MHTGRSTDQHNHVLVKPGYRVTAFAGKLQLLTLPGPGIQGSLQVVAGSEDPAALSVSPQLTQSHGAAAAVLVNALHSISHAPLASTLNAGVDPCSWPVCCCSHLAAQTAVVDQATPTPHRRLLLPKPLIDQQMHCYCCCYCCSWVGRWHFYRYHVVIRPLCPGLRPGQCACCACCCPVAAWCFDRRLLCCRHRRVIMLQAKCWHPRPTLTININYVNMLRLCRQERTVLKDRSLTLWSERQRNRS